MGQRGVIGGVAVVAVLGFAALTVSVVVRDGLTVLVGASVLVLALFTFGIIGALLNPPDE